MSIRAVCESLHGKEGGMKLSMQVPRISGSLNIFHVGFLTLAEHSLSTSTARRE